MLKLIGSYFSHSGRQQHNIFRGVRGRVGLLLASFHFLLPFCFFCISENNHSCGSHSFCSSLVLDTKKMVAGVSLLTSMRVQSCSHLDRFHLEQLFKKTREEMQKDDLPLATLPYFLHLITLGLCGGTLQVRSSSDVHLPSSIIFSGAMPVLHQLNHWLRVLFLRFLLLRAGCSSQLSHSAKSHVHSKNIPPAEIIRALGNLDPF